MNNFGQYMAEVHKELFAHPELRVGQVLFNTALNYLNLQTYAESVRGTISDPFYYDSWSEPVVVEFLENLIEYIN